MSGVVKLTKAQREIAEKFARGALNARQHLLGHDLQEARMGWLPTVAGKHVTLKGAPANGYATKPDAIQAAREYRSLCRAALQEAQP